MSHKVLVLPRGAVVNEDRAAGVATLGADGKRIGRTCTHAIAVIRVADDNPTIVPTITGDVDGLDRPNEATLVEVVLAICLRPHVHRAGTGMILVLPLHGSHIRDGTHGAPADIRKHLGLAL